MLNDPQQPLMAVGIGNSCVQAGYFPPATGSPSWIPSCRIVVDARTNDWQALRAAMPSDAAADTPWYLASVFAQATHSLAAWLTSQFPAAPVHRLTNSDFPVVLSVEQPDNVGTDRVAAATAVTRLKACQRPAIFADAGTAITVNAISREGEFLGGAILPGTTTAGKALFGATDQLPEISITAESCPPAVGRSTHAAIASGIYWGSVGAVDWLIRHMAAEHKLTNPEVFVSGGFGPALAKHLTCQVTNVPELVLSGIAIAAREPATSGAD